jgi:DNA-binding protein H-NS
MTTPDQSSTATQANVAEVEVIKSLEQRGVQGLDTLSLEELQILTERKRKQIHLEATEKKATLENQISSIEAKIHELNTQKQTLTEELTAVMKSLGLEAANGAQRSPRPRKPKKSEESATPPTSES